MKNAVLAVGLFLLAMAGLARLTTHVLDRSAEPTAPETAGTVPGRLDVSAGAASGVADTAEISALPDLYTEADYERFKSEYNCELAADVRTRCEAVDRGPQANEECLQLGQYYTYARHCGMEP